MSDESDFIALVTPGALRSQVEHGVPAAVTVAQAILESNWGRSALAVGARNLFGIKAGKDWTGRTITKGTMEWDGTKMVPTEASFRVYDDVAGSIDDHGKSLRSRTWYADAFKTSTPDDFVRALVNEGEPRYATDPDYAAKVIGVMDRHNLRDIGKPDADAVTRAELERLAGAVEDLEIVVEKIRAILASAAGSILGGLD